MSRPFQITEKDGRVVINPRVLLIRLTRVYVNNYCSCFQGTHDEIKNKRIARKKNLWLVQVIIGCHFKRFIAVRARALYVNFVPRST
jgi:hypothetical protein